MDPAASKYNKRIIAIVVGIVAFIVAFFGITWLTNVISGKGSEEQIVTYQKDSDGVVMKLTYYAKGDKVYKQTTENVIPYSTIGAKSEAEARELLDSQIQSVQNIKGYTDELNYGKDSVTETVMINYDEINPEEAKNIPGAYFDGNLSKGVSLEKSIKYLEESGYKKVE